MYSSANFFCFCVNFPLISHHPFFFMYTKSPR
nr:MAG TPA: Putative GTP cyclohydrolase 1 type-related protein [Caudoviricetes sp.]